MERIIPSADLRNKYNEIMGQCKKDNEPIFITVNGRGDSVLMSIGQYEQMQAERELVQLIAEGENDIKNAKIVSAEDCFANLKLLTKSMVNNGKSI